ncbi:MAG: BlaI/MecI/CopY family transcriptional regulator [Planctomycetes bacterium]|nr:BlaI/MecI/CopY family transcriptional regulator [Planctomycetota bacterium]
MDPLSRAEWDVMKVVWDRGEALVRDVKKDLAKRRGWARNTVRTLLERLVEKGYIEARRVGPVDLFSAKVPRGAAVGHAIEEFVDGVLDGAVAPFITYLVERRDIDPEEIEGLRKALVRKGRKRS